MAQVSRINSILSALTLVALAIGCEDSVTLSAPYSQSGARQIFTRSSKSRSGHFCYISPESRLFCYGDTSEPSFHEVQLPQKSPDEKWFSVSAGYKHTCALTDAANLFCWGDNQFSQLGQPGRPFDQPAAQPLPVPGKWLAVAAGGSYTCAITAQHELQCFGTAPGDGWQLLGGSRVLTLKEPRAISNVKNWITLSSGSSHLCAINDLGELWCLGENRHGRLDRDVTGGTLLQKVHKNGKFKYVTANERYTCAVTEKGQLFCQGDARLYPDYSGNVTPWWQVTGGDWASVAIDNGVICGLENNGDLVCFGDNYFSQLGVDTPFGRSTMGRFQGPFVAAMPFGHTNCGLKADGSWWCAGHGNTMADLLPVAMVPKSGPYLQPEMALGEGYGLVTAGQKHTCAVRWDKNVYCFGDNSFGQCGQDLSETVVMQPKIVDGLSLTVELSCGANHCCARNEADEVRCFGDNREGQFAPASVGQILEKPQLLSKKFRTVAAGFEHTCGIDTDGNAVCYGSGKEFGAAANSYGPFKLTGGPWNKVIMGRNNICFNNKYQLSCLGDNRHGQLFETGVWARRSPNTLKMAAVKDVAIANNGLFVIKRDNTLGCWGAGQLCWPAVDQKENSVHLWTLDGTHNFKAIWANENLEAREGLLCGILENDKVACLGDNYDGTFIKEPKEVELSGNYKVVAVGGRHSCVLNGAGELFCMGDNSRYQLGLPLPGRAEMKQLWPVVSE